MSAKKLLEELKKRGVKRVVLEFSGTDDSGSYDYWLEPSEAEIELPKDLWKTLENWIEKEFDRLCDKYGISFNNSGSRGSLTIDLLRGTVEFEEQGHVWVPEQEELVLEVPFKASVELSSEIRKALRAREAPEVLEGKGRLGPGEASLEGLFPEGPGEGLPLEDALKKVEEKILALAEEAYEKKQETDIYLDLGPLEELNLLEAAFSFKLDLVKGVLKVEGEAEVVAAYEGGGEWEPDEESATFEETPLNQWLAERFLEELSEA